MTEAAAPAVLRLRHRAQFVAAARGQRWNGRGFTLQAAARRAGGDGEIGVGFTTTKRLGGAVVRNRIRRRLREAARLVMPGPAMPGFDYVLLARAPALACPFEHLTGDLSRGLLALAARLRTAPALVSAAR